MIRYKEYLFLLFILLAISAVSAPLSSLDSLRLKYKNAKEDSVRVAVLNDLAAVYNNAGYANDTTLTFAQEALAISQKRNYKGAEANAYLNMGTYFEMKGNNKQALDNFLLALDIAEKNDKKPQLADIYGAIGGFYREVMKNYSKSLEYSEKGLALRKELGNTYATACSLTNIGDIYYDMNKYDDALKYFTSALDIFDTLPNKKNNQADVENNIGGVYTDLKQYDEAIKYYQKALATYQELKSEEGIAISFANIGNLYNMKDDVPEGIKYLEQSLAKARKINAKDIIAASYSFLAEGYSKLNDYKKAFDYQSALLNLKDTIFSETSAKQINDMQVKYDTDKKEKENKILELSVNKQKIINYSILAGLLLVIALAFFIYRGYRDKKKANEALGEKNKIIEEINKDILDSINYAKRIQHAILTSDEYLAETLGDYFILYKPRDVVSGDFYWCYENNTKVIFTAVDCTGHGVPGAFMSMIGNSLLNEIVIENGITDAAQILNTLRSNLLKTLQQKGQNAVTRDGMDIALCVWDKIKNEMQYSGANNSLYLARNTSAGVLDENKKLKFHSGNLYEILPDKQPIGYMEDKIDKLFTSYTFQLQKGDTIYITTDGYADQFGGEANKKFTKKKLRELLSSIAEKPLSEQKEITDRVIEKWKSNTTQTDDICLIGVKIS